MRRGLLAVVILGLLLVAPPAAAPAVRAALPGLFARQIHAINTAANAPAVLLPRAMPLDAKHLYPSGGPSGRRYDLEIGAVKNCAGANACFVADFTAAPGRTVFGRRVTVTIGAAESAISAGPR